MIKDSLLDIAVYASHLNKTLIDKEIAINVGRDFNGFVQACNIEGKSKITPPLNPDFVDIDPSDMLWIEAFSNKDRIAVQAIRLETISVSLEQHLNQQYKRIYCNPDQTRPKITNHAPATREITGKIAYHGDLFVHADYRRAGLAKPLSRLAIVLSLLRWWPDYFWGYIDQKMVESGYASKIGYLHAQPRGTHWSKNPPTGIRENDWFVWSTADDISYICECEANRLRTKQAVHFPLSDKVTEVVNS